MIVPLKGNHAGPLKGTKPTFFFVLRMGLPVSYRNERIARLLSKC